jgi:hypothetical protein
MRKETGLLRVSQTEAGPFLNPNNDERLSQIMAKKKSKPNPAGGAGRERAEFDPVRSAAVRRAKIEDRRYHRLLYEFLLAAANLMDCESLPEHLAGQLDYIALDVTSEMHNTAGKRAVGGSFRATALGYWCLFISGDQERERAERGRA